MNINPHWELPAPPKVTSSLARVLEQSERVKLLVEQSAEDLASVNEVLKREFAGRAVLEKTAAAESKVQEASEELSAVNRALEGEIWYRQSARRGSFHDLLTGLPNRALFNDRLGHGLEQAKRHDWILAVMLLDLDRFRNVNAVHGREAGDSVLRQSVEPAIQCGHSATQNRITSRRRLVGSIARSERRHAPAPSVATGRTLS